MTDPNDLKEAIDLAVDIYLRSMDGEVFETEDNKKDLDVLEEVFSKMKREILFYIRKNEDDSDLYTNVEALRDMISLLHSLGRYQSPPEEL